MTVFLLSLVAAGSELPYREYGYPGHAALGHDTLDGAEPSTFRSPSRRRPPRAVRGTLYCVMLQGVIYLVLLRTVTLYPIVLQWLYCDVLLCVVVTVL